MRPTLLLLAAVTALNYGVSLSDDTGNMKTVIENHFSEIRNHEVDDGKKEKAREYIYNQFTAFGLEAEYQTFNVAGLTTPFKNVIGVRKGSNFGTASDKLIGVVAHYDTVKYSPGVDDNGSGVAAMLEVARQLHANNVNTIHTVLFLSPDMEEYSLIGSERFVTDWLPQWTMRHYGDAADRLAPYGAIVLDTVMEFNTSGKSQTFPSGQQLPSLFPEAFKSIASDDYSGDFIALIYRQAPDATLAQGFLNAWSRSNRKKFEIESFALPLSSPSDSLWGPLNDFFRSDHTNFWLADIPAVFLSDTANFRGDMIQCYHQSCDNVENMLTDENIAFLGKTADSIYATIVTLAGSDTSGSGVISHSLVLIGSVLILNTIIQMK